GEVALVHGLQRAQQFAVVERLLRGIGRYSGVDGTVSDHEVDASVTSFSAESRAKVAPNTARRGGRRTARAGLSVICLSINNLAIVKNAVYGSVNTARGIKNNLSLVCFVGFGIERPSCRISSRASIELDFAICVLRILK